LAASVPNLQCIEEAYDGAHSSPPRGCRALSDGNQLWSGVVQKMRDSFTCLTVDLPGLGKTPKTSDGLRQLESLAEKIEQIRVENNIEKWHVVGHDAGSAIAVHYAHRFQVRVDRLALLSPAVFPELKPFHLFRIVRSPVIGELLAPAVNAIFWRVAMRQALEPRRRELNATVEDFHAPFSGPFGAWRLMSILRWGNPAEGWRRCPPCCLSSRFLR